MLKFTNCDGKPGLPVTRNYLDPTDDYGQILSLLKDKYGSFLKVEFGPGRIAQAREFVTIGLNPSADYFCDIYCDLEEGIPLPDKSIDSIYSNQFLEHLKRDHFIWFMDEMWRVLKSGGQMTHCVPHFLSPWAFADPTHRNWFSEKSFIYFCQRPDGTPFVEKFSDYGIECNFILEEQRIRRGLDITVKMRKP